MGGPGSGRKKGSGGKMGSKSRLSKSDQRQIKRKSPNEPSKSAIKKAEKRFG